MLFPAPSERLKLVENVLKTFFVAYYAILVVNN